MTDSFVPPSLRADCPRIEVWDDRHRVHASLAGFSLTPGKTYRLRVFYAGREASTWRVKTAVVPATISPLPDQGAATNDFHEIPFRVPVWPENFVKSLALAAADIELIIEFPNEDRPSQRVTVPMCLRPSKFALLSVIFPILIYISNVLNTQSQTFADYLSSNFETNVHPVAVSISFSVIIWLCTLAIYLWWKSKRQPAVRAARHLKEFQNRLAH